MIETIFKRPSGKRFLCQFQDHRSLQTDCAFDDFDAAVYYVKWIMASDIDLKAGQVFDDGPNQEILFQLTK